MAIYIRQFQKTFLRNKCDNTIQEDDCDQTSQDQQKKINKKLSLERNLKKKKINIFTYIRTYILLLIKTILIATLQNHFSDGDKMVNKM